MGLLDTLYSDCKGYLDLRAIQKGKDTRQAFYLLDDARGITAFIKQHRGWNLFFGVATRDGAAGKKANIVSIPAVWVDVDFKRVEESVVGPLIAALPFQPTCKVQSGGGLHLYWKLREPSGPADMPRIESLNRALTMQLQGDMTATEAARILRIPNTHNYKYVPAREVLLVYQNGSSYNLCDLEEMYPYLGEESVTGESVISDKNQQQLNRIMQCRFMNRCRENAQWLDEPEWRTMITQLVREPGGCQLIHTLSKSYQKGTKRYSKTETDKKILLALEGPGPQTCQFIKNTIWDCGSECGVKSPAALAFKRIDFFDTNDTNDTNDTVIQTIHSDTNLIQDLIQDSNPHGITGPPDDSQSNGVKYPADGAVFTKKPVLNDSDKVRKWLEITDGVFHYTDLARDLQINIHNIRNILTRLVKENTIERIGTKSGTYQRIDTELERMVLFGDTPDEYECILPLGLTDLVKIQPGSIVVVAGDGNAAKTAFCLEFARLNILSHKIRYINSETPTAELNARLLAYQDQMDINLWHRVEFVRRPEHYHHHLLPNDVTIIDFLDMHENTYMVSDVLMRIHERLRDGICIVAMQKRQGAPVGKGGEGSAEKARLYVTLSRVEKIDKPIYTIARIFKCKIPRDSDRNVTGMCMNFSVPGGVKIRQMDNWHRPSPEEFKLCCAEFPPRR